MGKTLLLIHGRSWKPDESDLKALWNDSLDWGFERDYAGTATLQKWKDCRKEFVYYGDISNKELRRLGKKRPLAKATDLADRKRALSDLRKWEASDFTKRNYKKLPGSGPWKEAIAE